MKSFGEVVERLRRSTVQVTASDRRGAGSGIVWNSDGLILTNAHVARASGAEVELWDGRRLRANVVKRDARLDLAALQVSAADLPSVVAGDSARLRPGELVIAVGNPLGFVGAVSTGVVHAVASWIQSTVRLAPGNSGGPLANARGEVIGVNSMVSIGGRSNLALAIPTHTVLRFMNESSDSGAVMGVTVRTVAIRKENTIGFLIVHTRSGSPAEHASLLIGDLLIGANGRRFQHPSDLEQALRTVDGTLLIHFRRGGAPQERTVAIQLDNGKAAAA